MGTGQWRLRIKALRTLRKQKAGNTLEGQEASQGPEADAEESADDHTAVDMDNDHATNELWMDDDVTMKLNAANPKLHPPKKCTIFKVLENICRSKEEAYAPSLVSIGPFHQASDNGSIPAMQGYRWRCVRYLLSRHQSGDEARKILNRCLLELKAREDEVRSCYAESLELLSTHELASIMLSDGCFIIYLLLRRAEQEEDAGTVENKSRNPNKRASQESLRSTGTNRREAREKIELVLDIGDEQEELNEPLLGNLWTWNLVLYDLLKLENQIPFFVIRIIFKHLKTPADNQSLVKLALLLFRNIHPGQSKSFRKIRGRDIHHLLHLFHSSIVMDRQPSVVAPGQEAIPEWIPSATDLARAGVKFRKKKKFNSFLDVSFEKGVLELPHLRLYDYTSSLFRNLIAFEQCYPHANTCITNYALFMDCIIDAANDVRLLDLKEILINKLGTDEEAAHLFNQLCSQVHYDPRKNYLKDVA